MDHLSITASIIALVQISTSIISVCRGYITNVKDSPNDLWTMLVEVGSLKIVLETLQLLAETEGGDGGENILEKLEGPGGPLVGCQNAMEDLEILVPPPMIQAAGGKQNRVALCLKALAWTLDPQRDNARGLLENIGRFKATMSLALTTEAA
jgi:hypothetical protein